MATADQCIIDYIRKTRNVIIGEKTAEDIKLSVETIENKAEQFEIKGRNLKLDFLTKYTLLQKILTKH